MGLKVALLFGKGVGKSRWFVLFVSFLIISFSGVTYIFGFYSPENKSVLEYDQKTPNTLGFFKELGANLGITSGILNEVAPAWFVLVGGVMNLTGFLLVWFSVTGRMAKFKKWQMFTYITVGSNSQIFTNTGALITCVKNSPQSRGIVLRMLKGFAGLSSSIFTQIYHALYGNDLTSLILLIGWLPCLVCLTFMIVVRLMNPTLEFKELNRLYYFLCIALALAGFLIVVIIIENHVKLPPVGFKVVAASVVVFLVLPLAVVTGYLYDLEASKQNNIMEDRGNAQAPAPHRSDLLCTGVSCFRLRFIIMKLVSLLGAIISGFLVARAKDFHKGDLYAKYQAHHQKERREEMAKIRALYILLVLIAVIVKVNGDPIQSPPGNWCNCTEYSLDRSTSDYSENCDALCRPT